MDTSLIEGQEPLMTPKSRRQHLTPARERVLDMYVEHMNSTSTGKRTSTTKRAKKKKKKSKKKKSQRGLDDSSTRSLASCATDASEMSTRSEFSQAVASTYFIPGITGKARCLAAVDPVVDQCASRSSESTSGEQEARTKVAGPKEISIKKRRRRGARSSSTDVLGSLKEEELFKPVELEEMEVIQRYLACSMSLLSEIPTSPRPTRDSRYKRPSLSNHRTRSTPTVYDEDPESPKSVMDPTWLEEELIAVKRGETKSRIEAASSA